MDTVDGATRSRIMASVGRRDTGPEITLRRALHSLGLRYRLHVKSLPGSPDIVFPRYKAVAFVHGCFWHRHDCRFTTTPTTRRDFWTGKFEANKMRDDKNITQLLGMGWRVAVVWECALRTSNEHESGRVAQRIAVWLAGRKRIVVVPKG